ncbi:OLM2B protein, partial [Nothocercus nigrocapillus]|nr:OLM2B protein [Nothocercus nigrocapillus]
VCAQLLGDYDKVKAVSEGSDCRCKCLVRPLGRGACQRINEGSFRAEDFYTVETITSGPSCKCACVAPPSALNPCEGDFRLKKLREAESSDLKLSSIMEMLESAFYGLDLLKLHSVTTKLVGRVEKLEETLPRAWLAPGTSAELFPQGTAVCFGQSCNDLLCLFQGKYEERFLKDETISQQINSVESLPELHLVPEDEKSRQLLQRKLHVRSRPPSKPTIVRGVTYYKAHYTDSENDIEEQRELDICGDGSGGRRGRSGGGRFLGAGAPSGRQPEAPSSLQRAACHSLLPKRKRPRPRRNGPRQHERSRQMPFLCKRGSAARSGRRSRASVRETGEIARGAMAPVAAPARGRGRQPQGPQGSRRAVLRQAGPAVCDLPGSPPRAPPGKSSACRDTLSTISGPTTQNTYGRNEGAWMKDPLAKEERIYVTNYYYGNTLVEFRNLDNFKQGRWSNSYKLPYSWIGTGHVVYNGSFYYNRAFTRNIIKYDLKQRYVAAWAMLHDVAYEESTPWRWRGHSDVDFAVDENGLWVIYPAISYEGFNQEVIVLSKLNAADLSTQKETTWRTGLRKNFYGNCFVICGVLYAVDSYNKRNANISYAFDTHTNTQIIPRLLFENEYAYTTQIDYNPKDRLLYAWDNGHQVTYHVIFAY